MTDYDRYLDHLQDRADGVGTDYVRRQEQYAELDDRSLKDYIYDNDFLTDEELDMLDFLANEYKFKVTGTLLEDLCKHVHNIDVSEEYANDESL